MIHRPGYREYDECLALSRFFYSCWLQPLPSANLPTSRPASAQISPASHASRRRVRASTSLAPAWGVELEFAHPSELENDISSNIGVLLAAPASNVFPQPVGYRISLEQRTTTVSALAWVRQRPGQTVEVVYLAGVGFNRTAQETTIALSTNGRPQLALPSRTRITDYSTGPVVGLEARIALTEHARLVPGLRLHDIGGNVNTGWLLRLGVGLGWSF